MMSFLIAIILFVWAVILVSLDINMVKSFSDNTWVDDMKDSLSWLFYHLSKGSALFLWLALMVLGVIISLILPAICYVCAGQLGNSLVIQSLLKYIMWLIITCGIVEAIMYPFGLADIYNNDDNVKLSRMSKVSIVFDMIEMAIVVFTIIEVIIGG
jgi:hypothetical protein